MEFIKLQKVTPGKNHGIYETNEGSKVRKPLGQKVEHPGQKVEPYWDAKSVLLLAAMIVGVMAVAFLCALKIIDLGTTEAKAEKEEIVLDVKVLEGDVLYETNDTVALLAPAKYKIVRAAYGDDCFYNLAGGSTYGSGEDAISVSGSYKYTYEISCQPLASRGEITSKAKTVIVLQPAEIRSAEVALSSR